MAYEIERKFLVQDESWRASAGKPVSIRQAYLVGNGSMSLRIRIKDERRATLTIKSAAAELRRLEFEYEIPLADANALFDLREGENEGLVIAEIELPHEDELFERPSWLGQEITADPRYSNAGLAMTPFGTWRAPCKQSVRDA